MRILRVLFIPMISNGTIGNSEIDRKVGSRRKISLVKSRGRRWKKRRQSAATEVTERSIEIFARSFHRSYPEEWPLVTESLAVAQTREAESTSGRRRED